jgi:hypothetical protein
MQQHPATLTRPLAATLLATALALPGAAQAVQGMDLMTTFADFQTWSKYGDATSNTFAQNNFLYSMLRLTEPGSGNQAGAGWAPMPLELNFNEPFYFATFWYIPPIAGDRGDGFTMVLSTERQLGTGGSGLGYEGLPTSSVAMAVDTFHFDGEPVSPSLQILSGGSVTPLTAVETGLGDTIRDPNLQWRAEFTFTPSGNDDNTGTLEAKIRHFNLGTFTTTTPIDFGALGMDGEPIWFGFTAGNGLAVDGHVITSAMPIPEPGSWALMLGGAGVLALVARRRRAA